MPNRTMSRRDRCSFAVMLVALLLQLSATGAWASGAITFRRLAIPDAVPAHLCSALAQDHSGFLWFGTQGGLVRYDGYTFRTFEANPADPRSLAGNYVRSLLVAHDARLWVGTFSGGLSVYDPATEQFTRYQHRPDDVQSLTSDRVEGLAEDRAHALWIATSAGLDRLDPATGRIQHFHHDSANPFSLADDRVRGLLVDRDGRLWVGSRAGLQRVRADSQSFERVASQPNAAQTLAADYVERLFQDRAGRIWIGTAEHGAAVLDPATGSLTRFAADAGDDTSLSHWWVYGFTEPRPDEIWVATFGGGVDVIDARSMKVIDRLRSDATLANTIGGDRVGAILTDRSGMVWVGTWGQGVAHHDPGTRAFHALRYSPLQHDGLASPSVVRAMETSDGNLWIGSNGEGIDVLDPAGRRVDAFRKGTAAAGALSDGSITCLVQTRDGTIWVATLDGSLHRLRKGSHRFDRLGVSDGLPGGAIRTITSGPDDRLWVGAAEGMAVVDPGTMKVKPYKQWPGAGNASPAIEAIAVAHDGALWVGSDNGLFHFDPKTERAVRIGHDPSQKSGLLDNWVPDLMIARDGTLWVGTAAGVCTLASWDGTNATFVDVMKKIGHAPHRAETLIQDDQGWVWVGPRMRIDPRTLHFMSFGVADGASFHSYFIASRARTRDGRLLFGSAEGLLVVQPSALSPWTFAPPAALTDLRVNGVHRPGSEVLRTLSLPASDNLRFDFTSLDYSQPDQNRYRYRLEGLETEWTAADATQRSASYSRLPPGNYVLHIEGTNRTGTWSPLALRIGIEALPAFYQTLWFRTLALFVAAALAYLLYRLRIRQLRERSARLETLVAMRTSELAATNAELQNAYAKIEEASLTDPLTRLRNRRFLEQTIESDVARISRALEDGHDLGNEGDLIFLLLDLDHFKSVNDTYGHTAGDLVLQQLAEVLRATFRTSDAIIRWGGEEFLIVVRFIDRRNAAALAEKLRTAVAAHRFDVTPDTTLERTVSIGFASFPVSSAAPRAVSWEQVVDAADRCLYVAKRSGRNAWVGVSVTTGDPAELNRFRDSPATALSRGAVKAEVSAAIDSSLVWD
jgi:diguanylate cyclase (GGDEF)-like protein